MTDSGTEGKNTSLIPLLRSYGNIDELKFCSSSDISVTEIGDGNLNDILRVQSNDRQQSVIVKRGPPYIKCLGPDYPLTTERTEIEYNALCRFHELSPGSVPMTFFYSKEHNIFCMEDLNIYRVLRKDLIQSQFDVAVAKDLAKHIAVVHRDTHVGKIGNDRIKQLDQEFRNPDMVNLTEQYIFTRPFTVNDPTNKYSDAVKERIFQVYEDEDVLSAARRMKDKFLNKKECLCHGDLHTSSVMVDSSNAKMIDLEFAFVGPAAFDIGVLVANYIFQYYHHMSIEKANDQHRKFAYFIVDVCKSTVNQYLETMSSCLGEREEYVKNLMSEIAGFAGCEIIRRILGAAHVEDLNERPYAEQDALGAGIRLLHAIDRIHSIDFLMVIALMLT